MNSVENANSQSHEWLREINHLLPLRSNRQPRHGQISFLEERTAEKIRTLSLGKGQGGEGSRAVPGATHNPHLSRTDVPPLWDGCVCCRTKPRLSGNCRSFAGDSDQFRLRSPIPLPGWVSHKPCSNTLRFNPPCAPDHSPQSFFPDLGIFISLLTDWKSTGEPAVLAALLTAGRGQPPPPGAHSHLYSWSA